jgi:hypothetical protein
VNGTPNASGYSKEDIVRLLLQNMYMERKAKASTGEADLSENKYDENGSTEAKGKTDANNGTSEKTPASWTFAGFTTLMLSVGPVAHEEQRIDFFLIKDTKEEVKKSYGGAAMQEDKKEQNELKPELKFGGEGPGACAKTFDERVQVVALDLQVSRFDQERQGEAFLLSRLKPIFCSSRLTVPTLHATRNWKVKGMVSMGQ